MRGLGRSNIACCIADMSSVYADWVLVMEVGRRNVSTKKTDDKHVFEASVTAEDMPVLFTYQTAPAPRRR